MTTFVPGCRWRPISHNFTAIRRPRTNGAVVHVTASVTATSQFGWFNNPAANASSHVHVDIFGGSEQYVDADFISWCQRAGNLEYFSIETQGGATGEWTPPQAAEILRILVWAANHFGFPLVDMMNSLPGARGVGTHRYGIDPWRVAGGQVWGGRGKVCPGHERQAQFKSGIFFNTVPVNNPIPTPTPIPIPTPTPTREYNMDRLDLRNAHNVAVRGRHVDNLQGLLLAAGFGPAGLVDPRTGRPDGVAGGATKSYVGQWQVRTNTGDGQGHADWVVGDGTWKSLIEY